jgi:hypothetical protein
MFVVAGTMVAMVVLSSNAAFAQAPGGYARCLAAGQTAAICQERGRQIRAGTLMPDANFGLGSSGQVPSYGQAPARVTRSSNRRRRN